MRKLLILLCAAGILCAGQAAAAAPSVEAGTEQVTVRGRTVPVNTVRVDLRDPLLTLEPVTALNAIGYDEPFTSMIDRTGAAAAINGTFFNAYEKEPDARYPNGLLVASGETVHSGVNQSLILMADKLPVIRNVELGIRVTFAHGKQTSTYFPWGINKYYGAGEGDQVVWYTPAMGRTIDYPNGTKIVIRENVVTQITEDPVSVPGDGYVFFAGNSENNKKNLLPRIQVGDTVDLESVAKDAVSGEAVDPGLWLSAIGAGPKLVTAGAVDLDAARDGFDDPKLATQANRRSFVGIDGEGRLVMGTVDGVTLQEAAEAVLALGLREAMNLDGGASSGLYAEGSMLTRPGRSLSNALIVRRLAEPRTQLEVNGRFRPEFQGFIRNDTSLVPIRPLLQALGAEFKWNEEAGNLSVVKDGKTLLFTPGRGEVLVDGKKEALDTPPVIVDGRLYVPVRYVVESWGGKVKWDGALYRVSLEF